MFEKTRENNGELDWSVGEITGFVALAGSGLASIFIDGLPVLCENTMTIRALDDAFENFVGKDLSINVDAIVGQKIVYSVGDYGLLEWFSPVDSEDVAEECASCERLLGDNDEKYFGELRTYYEGQPLCESCYYESDADATVVRADSEQEVITSTRNETEGDFWVSWHSTDAWRGYYETHSVNYSLVNSAELLSYHESEEMLAKFDERIRELFNDAGIEYARVFARSSNVFYSNYDLFVRNDQLILANVLVQRAKFEVDYDNPQWYRNIVFDSDSLSKLSELFPEVSIKTDQDAVKLVEVYKDKIVDELQMRIRKHYG